MIQTIAVYLFLLFTMAILITKKIRINELLLSNTILGIKNAPFIIALLLFAVIMGMRYGVGVDHLKYLEGYVQYQEKGIAQIFSHVEPGFSLISKLFAFLGIHFWIYFAFWAFMQIFFLFYALKRNQESVLPFLVLTFILGGTFLSFMNGIRQQLVFCVFVFSIEFIQNNKPIKYYILIFFASIFHSSALILLPIYLLFRYKTRPYFNGIGVQFILLGIAFFLLYQNYIEYIFYSLSNLIEFFGYGVYLDMLKEGKESLLFSLTRPRGIGFYLIVLLNIILIASSNRVKNHFSYGYFSKIYDLYFIGVIYGYITNGSILLARPNYYFVGFTFVVAAYTLLYFYQNLKESRNNILLFLVLFGIYLLIFIALIYRMDENTFRFVFFWQASYT